MLRATVLLSIGLLASSALSQFNPKTDMIFTAKDAVVVMHPVVVTKGKPEKALWSRDGKWIFLESEETKNDAKSLAGHIVGDGSAVAEGSETVLSLYGVEKRNQILLSRFPSSWHSLDQIEWLPGNRMVAFVVQETTAKQREEDSATDVLYVSSTGNGQTTQLLRAPQDGYIEIHTHERARGAVVTLIQEAEEGKTSVRAFWLGPDGKLSAPLVMKDGYFGFHWDSKGNGPYLAQRDPTQKDRKAQVSYFLYNFQNGAMTPVEEPNWDAVEVAPTDFTVKYGASISELSQARVQKKSLWLESRFDSEHKLALVTPQASEYEVSPALDAIYYESQELGMIRMLPRIPKEAAMKALQALVMRDAKQVGLAMQMYAADYDEEMPINNGDWMDNVDPYLKNRLVMDGFTYTYSGGNLSELKDPSKTEVGFKAGPGGRAVVYADGSVKWIPDSGPTALFIDRRVVIQGKKQISLCLG